MSKLLHDKFGYLLACVEPELVPLGVPRNSFNLEEVKELFGKTFWHLYYYLCS